MLKILKYELKQTWKMCTSLIGFILIGCMGLLLNPFNKNPVIFPLYMILCGLIIMGSAIYLFFYCMESFNREFARPQGYLMMTLPIKARDLIWAKFINQAMWNMLGALIIMGTWSLLVKHYLPLQIMSKEMGQELFMQGMINSVASYALTVFIVYFSIAFLSKQPRDNQYNFIKVIVATILNYLTSGIMITVSVLIPYGFEYGIPTSFKQLSIYIENNIGNINLLNAIITIIIAGIFYLITEYIINHKVQL